MRDPYAILYEAFILGVKASYFFMPVRKCRYVDDAADREKFFDRFKLIMRAVMGANYAIYIEDYVLSYLKREVDSLELSEIFFYGKRENGGRKFLVYGAGRRKEIAAFAGYELLDELVCRLTQAGPVFMVRERSGDYKTSSFQTFYANNEAMQNYLIEWTGMEGGHGSVAEPNEKYKEAAGSRRTAANVSFGKEEKRTGSAMSAQLCLILVVLVAIVISSTNSYRKMERLNQSAKEVFFAIENQEAGQESAHKEEQIETADNQERGQEKGTEILVERDTGAHDISVEDAVRAENAARAAEDSGDGSQTQKDTAVSSDTLEQDDAAAASESAQGGESAASSDGSEQAAASDGDSSEEALSRNITRYYEVERGDTLYTISQKIYGDTSRVERICEVNEITDSDRIREGQKIILP